MNIFKLLRYLKDELLIVLGTSSSETVLPQLMRKLEHLGLPRQVVGLTVPTGYSFNLDGTCIYLTLAALYIAQAQNVDLGIGAQLGILAVLLLTSKGAAGVTGSGFIVLAATLSSTTIPVAGIMLVFGIDKFMSECRALTNVCGNSVASIVVGRWEGVFDLERSKRVLDGDLPYYDDVYVPEQVVLPEEQVGAEQDARPGLSRGRRPQPSSRPRPPTVRPTMTTSSGYCERRASRSRPDRRTARSWASTTPEHVAQHDRRDLDGRDGRRRAHRGQVELVAVGAEQVDAVLGERVAGQDPGQLALEEQQREVVRDRVAGGDRHDGVGEQRGRVGVTGEPAGERRSRRRTGRRPRARTAAGPTVGTTTCDPPSA